MGVSGIAVDSEGIAPSGVSFVERLSNRADASDNLAASCRTDGLSKASCIECVSEVSLDNSWPKWPERWIAGNFGVGLGIVSDVTISTPSVRPFRVVDLSEMAPGGIGEVARLGLRSPVAAVREYRVFTGDITWPNVNPTIMPAVRVPSTAMIHTGFLKGCLAVTLP